MQSLHRYLKKNGQSQAKFADAVGLNKGYVSRLLSGERKPSITVIRKLSRATGIPVGTLVEESPE